METDYILKLKDEGGEVRLAKCNTILRMLVVSSAGQHSDVYLLPVEAGLLAKALLEFIHPRTKSDPCDDAVDMSRISPAEIRAHWRAVEQKLTAACRTLNHIDRNTERNSNDS